MITQRLSRRWAKRILLAGALSLGVPGAVFSQEDGRAKDTQAIFLNSPRFKIPFNVDTARSHLAEVQLWVSTDEGNSWQMHGTAVPGDRQFGFRAAAEGIYHFAVQTIDQSGNSFPSQSPPLKVIVDTTKPDAAMKADLNALGQLVIDIRVLEEHLNAESGLLRLRTDRESQWQEIPVETLEGDGDVYQKQLVVNLPKCREVALVFTIADAASNLGETAFQYQLPRTAAGDPGMTLASAPKVGGMTAGGASLAPQENSRIPEIPGAMNWSVPGTQIEPRMEISNSRSPSRGAGPGALASSGGLSLDPFDGQRGMAEELPPPLPNPAEPALDQSGLNLAPGKQPGTDRSPGIPEVSPQVAKSTNGETNDLGAYHCNARAFSLDYSVEALGGSTLSEIELWGTEDGGRTWQRWGTDPDRQSPFDVQVGNDGLFGFRMVIVSKNGIVSNRPKSGDSADVWVNVDTAKPTAKITRAVYGEGPEDGMLVIDYVGQDGHLVEKPITISYGESVEGPWTTIASGLSNTGVYLWKPAPDLPEKIYLRLESVDKAGNIGVHRLDVPIATRGLAPRGRIQGIRPIAKPNADTLSP